MWVMTCGCLMAHAGLSKREQAYQAKLSKYSSALQPGAKRSEVERYLRVNKLRFEQVCCFNHETSDLVQIGRTHAGWPFCSGGTVNVAFVFSKAGPDTGPLHPDPTDVLRIVKLEEVPGACF
jgi:hypothetical protein